MWNNGDPPLAVEVASCEKINFSRNQMPAASATVFVGELNLVVFEVRQLKGFSWKCSLCLDSAVGSASRARACLSFCSRSEGWGPWTLENPVVSMWDRRSLLGSWEFLFPVSLGKLGYRVA